MTASITWRWTSAEHSCHPEGHVTITSYERASSRSTTVRQGWISSCHLRGQPPPGRCHDPPLVHHHQHATFLSPGLLLCPDPFLSLGLHTRPIGSPLNSSRSKIYPPEEKSSSGGIKFLQRRKKLPLWEVFQILVSTGGMRHPVTLEGGDWAPSGGVMCTMGAPLHNGSPGEEIST